MLRRGMDTISSAQRCWREKAIGPAGGSYRPIGCVALLARYVGIALRTAPCRADLAERTCMSHEWSHHFRLGGLDYRFGYRPEAGYSVVGLAIGIASDLREFMAHIDQMMVFKGQILIMQ